MENSLRNTFNIRNWSLFELVWIVVFVGAGTVVAIFTKDSLLNYAILLTGILCVVLAAKGNIWNYAFGLVNSFGYAYVSYVNGLYGDMGLNILFFVPANIIGFFMWQKHLGWDSVEMRGLKASQLVCVLLVCTVSIGVLGCALSQIKAQNTPYIDATSTVLSIIATFLMMWRYKELDLPTNNGHDVKRVNYANEVSDEKTNQEAQPKSYPLYHRLQGRGYWLGRPNWGC